MPTYWDKFPAKGSKGYGTDTSPQKVRKLAKEMESLSWLAQSTHTSSPSAESDLSFTVHDFLLGLGRLERTGRREDVVVVLSHDIPKRRHLHRASSRTTDGPLSRRGWRKTSRWHLGCSNGEDDMRVS